MILKPNLDRMYVCVYMYKRVLSNTLFKTFTVAYISWDENFTNNSTGNISTFKQIYAIYFLNFIG